MKAKVIKRYVDKETKKTNEVNSEIEVSEKRFKEINSHELGPFLAQPKTTKEDKKPNKKK